MPLGYKDPGSIEAEILMTRTVFKGSILLLEGVDDSRFWRSRIDSEGCDLVIGDGKHNVVGAIERLDKRGFEGALGIVDKDFDELHEKQRISLNLVSTDAHDLECMLINSRSLEKLLGEHGDSEKIRSFESTTGKTVRLHLRERGVAFGRWRFAFAKNERGADPLARNIQRHIDPATWEVNSAELTTYIMSDLSKAEAEELREIVDSASAMDPWQLCVGHDLIVILRIGLQSLLGSIRASVGVAQISAILRAGYSSTDMQATEMYAEIRAWEQRNNAYRVLKLEGL